LRRFCVTRNWRPSSDCAAVALWLDHGQLRLEPRAACRHLGPVRFLVDASLPSRLPLEVLDRVRHVGVGSVDLSCPQRLVEESAGGADERSAGTVLLISGLLADEHDLGCGCALAEHGLGPELPERAGLATGRRLAQRLQRERFR